MSKSGFKLNRAGVGKLLRSQEMMGVCEEFANGIRSKCGEGYEVTTHRGKGRVNASVYAKTVEARQENAENNTLLKAMG